MMSVFFANSGEIDLDVIRVMGVSVKETNNPIGYFGTGLKFAIATLLRSEHEISLYVGGECYEFSSRISEIRGQDFRRVYMNDEALPFTTELGKNWEVWQAYRELHSNTLDENGKISDRELYGDTVIKVSGLGIDREYAGREKIFLSGEPIASNSALEVHNGQSRYVYYRGVRAGLLPEVGLFTYNILRQTELSEDRVFKDMWQVEYAIESNLPAIASQEVSDKLLSGFNSWDSNLNFSLCHEPSREFLMAAKQNSTNASMNESARKLVEKDMQDKGTFPPCEVSDQQAQTLAAGLEITRRLDCTLQLDDVTICETLGPNVHGLYHKVQDRIYISLNAVDLGPSYVAATLYEEWVHKTHGFDDKSLGMQNFLFHRLIFLAGGEDLSAKGSD